MKQVVNDSVITPARQNFQLSAGCAERGSAHQVADQGGVVSRAPISSSASRCCRHGLPPSRNMDKTDQESNNVARF
jgi:hypothetical protein